MLIFLCIVLTGSLCRTVAEQPYTFGPGGKYMCHCTGDQSCDTKNGKCTDGCADGWMGPGCQYRAIAGEKFQQLDVFGDDSEARKAMDGDDTTCSRSSEGEHSNVPRWWRVRFKGQELVSGLEILTTEQQLENFKGFKVYIEDSSDIKSQPSEETLCFEDTDGFKLVNPMVKVTCREPVLGNQLRIQLNNTTEQLVLCEVRIPRGRNVAFKAQTKSSKHHASPDLGVDGKLTQSSWQECSFLLGASHMWYEVDLGQQFSIHLLSFHFFDKNSGLQRNFHVKRGLNNTWTNLMGQITWINEFQDMEYRTTFEAREIKIEINQTTNSHLGICELQIFGDCPDNKCGLDCQDICHCKRHSIYSRHSGICDSGCKDGWQGSVSGKCDIETSLTTTPTPVTCPGHCKTGSTCNTDETCPAGCEPCTEAISLTTTPSPVTGPKPMSAPVTCPGHCKTGSTCNEDGTCPTGCEPGWIGNTCTEAVSPTTTPAPVTSPKTTSAPVACPEHCKTSSTCNEDGTCPAGCEPGWTGNSCTEDCPDGTYGDKCSQTCSGHCYKKRNCRKTDGHCEEGCAAGWKEARCDKECDAGRFGTKCTEYCSGHCKDGANCRKTNGHCPRGCAPGWFGPKCDRACHNSWGQNCSQKCGYCLQDRCNNVNGTCTHGCRSKDYTPPFCSACVAGTWGKDCQTSCGRCQLDRCDQNTGVCPIGCQPGVKVTPLCDQDCEVGTWGYNCSDRCEGCLDEACDATNGSCYNGCKPGYRTVPYCNETEKGVFLRDPKNDADSYTLGLVIAVIVLTVACIAFAIGFTVLMVKNRKRRQNTSNERVHNSPVPDLCDATENIEMATHNLQSSVDRPTEPAMDMSSVTADLNPAYQELGFRYKSTEEAYTLLDNGRRPVTKSASVDDPEYVYVS